MLNGLCMNGILKLILIEYRMKIVIKCISFCRIGVSRDGVMKSVEGMKEYFFLKQCMKLSNS